MKIEKIFLENFRVFNGRREISLNNFTAFIGKNDQGKSSILEALDIFFNDGKGVVKIENDDLNVTAKKDNGLEEFRIGVVFTQFPEEVTIDATNPTNIREEYLLNEEGKLEVWKTYKNGKLKQTSIRCNHPINDENVKDLLRKKIVDLKKIVEDKNIDCSDKRKSSLLRKAIRDSYGTNLKLEKIEIIVDAEDAKKIWEQLINYLPVCALFHSDRKNQVLDSEVQDPLNIAIEQIFKRDGIQNKLREIAQEIENEVRNIAKSTISKFKVISKQDAKIEPNIPETASLKWKDVYKNIGFNTDNNVPLNKRGSGFRRLMLLSFFLAEVEKQKSENKVHTIYAIEEPETSLHPDLQIELLNSLLQLSENDNYQILITTHSPQFIRILPIESIRYVENGNVEIFNQNILDKVIKNLGILPNIGKVLWCVEGKNDEQFLININQNISELKEIVDIKNKIKSGLLAFNLMNGTNCGDYIDRYIIKNTNAIEFHLYDKDKNERYKYQIENINKRKDGSKGILTQKREIENYVPKEFIEDEFKIKFDKNINWDEEDIPKLIADKTNIKEKDIKSILNGKLSKSITKQDLEKINAWNEVVSWFDTISKLLNKCTNNISL